LLLAGRWTGLLANADAQSAAGSRRRPEHVLRLRNGTRVDHGLRFSDVFRNGFGYAIAVSALGRPLQGEKWAWVGYALSLIGTVIALVPVAAGRASVLYTFYPPLLGSPWYYLGLALVIIGSYFWIAVMLLNFRAWKRENPGKPVPLAMFAITACALLWGWTALGAVSEVLFQILPVTFGWRHTIDAGLARTLFSVTLHAWDA
jgi:cytochrome c oxidase subunit 1